MAIENTTYKKKKNKQWLRYGTTSLIVVMGLGAGATGQAMAAEDPTTTDIDPTSTKTGEDDSQNTDSDNRDVDGDGLDDETGQPIPTNPSDPTMVNGSGTTSNPTDGEETTAVVETPADPIVVPAEETATVESSTDNVVETPTETVSTTVTPTTVVAEAPATTESTTMTPTTVTDVGATTEQAPVTETESVPEAGLASTESATSTPSVATTSVADTEGQSAETTAATTPESAQSDTALTTEESAAETADSENVTETTTADTTTTDMNIQDDTTVDTVADEQSDTDTTADTTSTTNDNDDVKPNSEVSSDASSATTMLSESASESKATVLGETSTQEATVLTDDYVPTTEPEGVTVSVDTTIPVPNKEEFTGSEYGLSSTVTVTYSDKYLWINLPAVYNLNSIDMDALKAYAVRNRMIISFLQDGEQAKNTTTGLTDAQQATFDLFNKDAFNLMPATEVTNDDGTIIVYWPDSTEASTTFDSVDHDDIRIWAETNGLGWVVASEAWRRTDMGQVPPAGDQVLDTSNTDLPAIIRNDANLLRTYFPIQYFLSASDKKQYVIFLTRENRTSDPWGQTTKPGETMMIAEINSSGIIGRTYLTNGQTINLNGTTITDRFSAGSGDYYIGNYYTSTSTTLQSWTMQGITTKSTLADANYYYAIDNGDGTYTKTDIRIPVNESAGAGGDAKTNTLTGGSGGSFPDEYIITSDVLAGYQLVPSLTYASGQMSSSTSGTGTTTKQTVRGKFMTNVYDQMSKSASNMYRTVLDPNNPFNLALVRAYGFDLSKVPVGAVVDKYVNSSGGYTVTIAWPVVDANGNETGQTSIIWDTGSNTIRFDTSASGGAATNPVKHYTIPTSPLTFYLQTNTTTGATSVVAATSVPTTAGYTFAKITGEIYKTTTGMLTFSDKDTFGNANILVATPDWLDEDRNGSIDGGSFTGFKNGGYGDKQNSFTIIGKFNVSGVNFYYVAAPQMATVGLKTAEKQADGTYKLVDTARTNTDGISNYANKTSGQKDSALQGVTGAVIGVARTGSTANDWSKINTKVPGYTYIGYTFNGGALQSVQKTDGTYAMPFENSNTKYNATASTSLSNGVITDSSADGIVLYYAIDSQQAQIKFVMADGTTAPANINLTGKTGGALTQDVASSIPAGYHIDTTKTTTTGSPAMTLSGTTVSGTYDATNNNLSATDGSLQTMTITLVADTQTVKVRYIDVNGSTKETGWTAADGTEITDWVQTVNGATGKTYTNALGSVSQSGYVIVAQDAGSTAGTFDNDTATDQTYYVYLKHNTVDVEGGKEGNARWTVRSTVRYRFEDGTNAASANVRTTEFLATVTYDAVTGEELAVTWETETYTFDDVESPVIQGYIADKLEAGAATVTYTSAGIAAIVTYKALGAWTPSFPDTTPDNPPSDITYPNDPKDPTQPDRSNPSVPVVPYVPGYTPEGPNGPLTPVNPNDPSGGYLPPNVPTDPTADTTIVYHANEQTVTVNYIYVADDGTRTTVKTESFTGKSNAAYTHELWDYENNPDQSYVLVSKDAGAESGVFDAADDETQVFNVILAIGTESVPGGKDDDPNQSDYTKTVTRTIHYVDQAGNQMVDANGEPVPDRIMRHTFTATVTYKVDSNVPVSVEWPNDAATFEEVKSPVIAGYVSDVTQVDADNIDHNDTDMTYTVTYKPMGSWTPSFPPNTENVPSDPIQYPNDPNNPTDNETPHDPAEPDDPVIPYVPGYTPEGPDGTPLKPVDPENPSAGYIPPAPTDPTGDTTINYTRNTQQIIVRYIDDTTNLEVPDLRQTFSGETDQAYTNTLADYAALGYTFVSADAGASAGTYDRDDSKTQVYLVHLTHGTVVVDGSRENDPNHDSYTSTVTSTVHYVYETDQTEAKPDSVQEKIFTASVTYDAVTGEVLSIVWPAESQNFDDVQTPVIDGYFASEGSVAGDAVDYNDANREETVTYTKLGSWIPHVPDLPEEEQLKTRVYPNDPNDASKVWTRDDPNYVEVPVPYIPGYTPTTDGSSIPLEQIDPNDVTKGYYPPTVPDNAAADTPIYYVAHPQTLVVVYVDISTGAEVEVTELQQTLTGTTNAAYTNTLSDYAARGYVLVKQDATATEGKYDNADNVTQFAKVYLDHGTVVVTPDNPGDPGSPMYPDVPDTPTWPVGTDIDGVKQTVNGVISYQYANGDEVFPDVTRTVTFERSITLDAVTGEQISATDWVVTAGDDDWPETPSPVKEGYYADISDILAVTIAPGDFDRSYMVTYYPMGQYVPVFPEGTENVPSDPITYPNDPDNPGDPLEPGQGTPDTPGDTDNPTVPYVPGFTPQGPDGTPLEPVDPDNPSAGYWPPKTPTDNPGGDTTITYTANEQKATVTFIDDTTGDTLQVVDLTGKSDKTDAYRTATDIATYERAGYVLVSDDYPTDGVVYDRVDDEDQPFTVHLKQVTITVEPNDPKDSGTDIFTPGDPVDPSDPSSPTYPESPYTPGDPVYPEQPDGPTVPDTPGDPGTPVDPDNPSGPTWPATPTYPSGVTKDDLNQTVTRTITYTYASNGEKASETVTETLTYSRTATVNAVTGAVTYGNWQTTDSTLDKVDSPLISGYVASQLLVDEEANVDAMADDKTVAITYTKLGQWVPSFPPSADDENVPSDPIDYPNNPSDPTAPLEPGEDNPNDPGTPANPTLPYVPGYTPEGPDGTPLTPVDPDNPSAGYWPPETPADKPGDNTVIHYVANDQAARITYIDDDTGLELAVDTIAGESSDTSTYTTADRIKSYEAQGYTLVSNDFPEDEFQFDRDDATEQKFEVHLKRTVLVITPDDPRTPNDPIFTPGEPVDPSDPSSPTYPAEPGTPGEPIDPANPSGPTWPETPTYPAGLTAEDLNQTVNLTVNYVYEDGTTVAHDPHTDAVHFTRTATLDTVTGEVTYSDWVAVDDDDLLDTYKSPVVDGYYADKAYSTAVTVAATDDDVTETVTYKKLGQCVPSFPATTPSAPTDPIDYPNDPSDPTVPTDPAENPSEPGTPENPTLPYVPGYTPEGPDGEPLTPADPSNPSSGYLPPNPTNPGDDTVITYVPADQVGSVTYVDQTTGETLVVDSLAGKSDEPGTYVTTDRIKQYEAMGYVLVSDDYPTDFTFDSDTAKSQDFTVTLKQATVVVTPDDPKNPSDPIFTPGDPVDPSDPSSPTYPEEPGTPGDPIDPNNPSGPTWPATPTYPAGVTAQDLNKTVTRTVTYVYEDGSEAATTVTDNVVFERTATVNAVTGVVTYGEWTAVGDDVDWQQVDSPMIVGYMADKASVEFVDVTGATESTSVVVTYTAVGQWVPHFPPGTENVPSDPINYPNNPDDPTNPADPGPDNPADPGTTDNPTLPYVPGFTPQGPDGQPLEPVNPSNPSEGYWPPVIPDDPKQSQDITYTANEQTARIVFIDDTTGTTLATDDIDGVSDEKSTYTTADRLAAYYAQGYTLVSDDYPADFAFDRVDGNVETFEVHLKHAAITVTPDDPKNPSTPIYTPGDPVDPSDPESPTYPAEPGTPGDPIDPDNPSGPTWPAVPTYPDGVTTTDLNETVNRTITYVDDKGETVFAEATDKVSFTRTATVDAVTGEVTYGAWVATGGDTTFDAVNSPVKTGYYADKEVVAETTGLTATTRDENVQVVYKPMGQWVPSFPAGTENVPSDPTTYPNDPAHADTPLEPGDSNTNVPGTPDNPTMPYVPGFTPQGPDGTPLEPVTPGSPEGGYWPPATPTDNPGGDTVVTYVADEQKATITYHDVTTDTDLSVDTIAGHSDETSSYTTAQRIAMYEQQGYRLVADGYPGTKFTFDRDTATDQAYIVQLERITQTITPDDPKTPSSPIFTPGDPVDPSDPSSPTYPEQPGTPGEPIDPDNPSGPTWPATPTYPAGLTHDDLNQTVTREVTYVYDRNGATAATTATETLTFTRTATLDTVSGEITYGDWIAADSDTTFDEVTSPTIAGYTANRASVAEATGVAATDADTSIEVRYVANEQHATITYIDDNTQQTIVMDDITGQSDGTTTYTTADRIAALQAQGYSLVNDGWLADFVFDTDDDTTQAFEVHLKHATITVDPDDPKTPSSPVYTPGDPVDPDDPDGPTYPAEPGTPGEPIDPNNPSGPTWPATPTYPDGLKTTDLNETVDRTITYVYEDGSEAAKTVTDNVQFTRTAEYDVVTGTVTYGDWVATNGDTTFDAVESPVITGYYADLTQVDETAGLTADSGDENVKVTCKQMGQWVPSFPANTPSVPTDPITYPNNPDDPTQPLEPGAPDYPVIPYVPGFTPAGPDGPLQPVDPTDPSKGYVPPATPTDNPGEDTTINYVANEQMATITFINDTTKTDLTVDTITGVSDATSTYTTAERIQAYLAQGYTLVSDGYPTDFTFDRDDSQTQAYEVHLKHATITITPSDPKTPSQPIYNPGDPVDPSDPDSPTYPEEPGNPGDPIDPDNPSGPTWPSTPTYPAGLTETDLNESVTQTITYVYADGQEASNPKTDTVTFSRTATLDPVTGAVTYGEWIAANSDTTFDAVVSPVITGYVADKQTVAEVTGIQATDADTDPVVTYTAMGQWVPSYPAGTTDVPTDPMTYPNDPADPTQPADPTAPNYPVIPDVPGFTPQGPDGPLQPVDPSDPSKGYVPPATPTDPTQDTTITYVANEQQATIAYIDKTTGKQLALDPITGHSDESSTYTTADKIAAYEAAGYVLVSDGYPGATFTFDREDDYDQTYEVILEHAVITVDPNDPKTPSSPIFTPGGPVDPDDPTSPTYPVNPGETPTPTYPAGVETADLNESVTQTITYTYADGTTAADDATDTVTFSRTATVDAVTGEVTYGDWIASNGDTTFDAVTSPVITGYVADKQTIAEVTGIAAKDADTTITVVYNQMGQWVPSFPAGTTDVPSSPMTYPNDPTDPTVPLTPGPENENNPGDPANPTLPFVPGFTPQGPDGPLQPVDPANPSSGYWPPTLPSDPTTDTTITYTADEQAATITYVDAVTNEILGVDHIKGGSDESHAYTTANRLAAYLASGYELVSDGYPTNFTFDRDTAVTQAYTVTLTHGSQTINPNDPKTPGTPINPDNPDGTKYPDGLKSTDLNESVTRTITYVDQAGKTMATAVKETIHFTRTATLDTVTGAYTYSAWEPTTVTSMDAVDSPVIAGYVADRQTVAALSDLTATSADMSEKVVYAPIGQYVPAFPSGVTDVPSTPIDYPNNPDDPTTTDTPGEDNPATPGTPDNPTMPYVPGFTPQGPDGPLQPVDPNNPSAGYWPPAPSETPTEDTTITYTANKQTATITYIDDETGRILAVDTITGGSAETSSYSPYNRIMVYKLAGMMLVSNGYPSHFTFDRDESVDQAFEVHFEGATITVTPDDPKVPGEPIYQPGDLIDPNDPDSPTFPDPLGEPGTPVDPDDPDSPTWPQPPVWPDGVTAADLREEVNQTITYIYEKDGSTAAKTVTDQVVFTRTITINVIAAQQSAQPQTRLARAATASPIVYSDWQAVNGDDKFDAKTSPVIPGYIADRLVVEEVADMDETSEDDIQQVVYRQLGSWVPSVPQVPGVKTPADVTYPNDPDDPTTDTTIVYRVDQQRATVNFIDQNTKQVLHVEQLTGDSYSKSTYTTTDQIAGYLAQGYVLVRDGYPAGGMTFDADSAHNQTFVVTLAHGTTTVDPNHPGVPGTPIDPNNPTGPKWPAGTDKANLTDEVERIVRYLNDAGQTVAEAQTQTVTFTRTATVDLVTGQVTYGPWQSIQSAEMAAITSPHLAGYIVDRPTVASATVQAGQGDWVETVRYHAVGSYVPQVPGGVPVDYVTNPNDPSGILTPGEPGSPVLPHVPGYVPVGPDGKPLQPVDPNDPRQGYWPPAVADPTQDTPITYVQIVTDQVTPDDATPAPSDSAVAVDHQAPVSDDVVLDSDAVLPTAEVSAASQLTTSGGSLAYTASSAATTEPTDVANETPTKHSGVLPYTGQDDQEGAKATGLAMLFGLFLGLFKRRKRKDESDETTKHHEDR
ncbi:mucin-binding protein [Weissella cibaria]|uniref:mucin-binding protein n=1 Tax=Weissella cibaria TaxID=137591 RepID=UPI00223B2D31|nr:mucus-binding protein [Weissella cibaria]